MRKFFLGILVFGLVLGLGNISLADQSQKSEKIIKVPGAEDFIVEDAITEDNAQQRALVENFGGLTFAMFFDLCKRQIPSMTAMPLEMEVYLARGAKSEKMAVILNDWGIRTRQGFIKSDTALFYYLNDLKDIIQERAPGFIMYFGSGCQDCIIVLVMLPEAKETAQKFVDLIKEKVKQ